MRSIIIFLFFLFALNINAQDTGIKTATIAVKGNCEECKKRIENAADIKGVKLAVWNETAQAVTVTYKADKVSLKQIEDAIAASGHDVGAVKGNNVSYSKLPSCCKYRDKKCELPKK